MDMAKCQALKRELADLPEPQLVSISRFFDGNDDLGSIGCNLDPHPGIGAFRKVLVGLLLRPDVAAVYAQVSELDPGEGSWPFADTVLVAGTISTADLSKAVQSLEPDEVAVSDSGVSSGIAVRSGSRQAYIWWD